MDEADVCTSLKHKVGLLKKAANVSTVISTVKYSMDYTNVYDKRNVFKREWTAN